MSACIYDCPPEGHDMDRHRGMVCGICGEPVTWFNDVPLRGFCWGEKAGGSEHREWSAIVPAKYNPYLPDPGQALTEEKHHARPALPERPHDRRGDRPPPLSGHPRPQPGL